MIPRVLLRRQPIRSSGQIRQYGHMILDPERAAKSSDPGFAWLGALSLAGGIVGGLAASLVSALSGREDLWDDGRTVANWRTDLGG
jgi:hypothetical protein